MSSLYRNTILFCLHLVVLGSAVWADDPLPRVLLLGDSIRQGYAPYVQSYLAGEADVFAPSDNSRSTANALSGDPYKLLGWLGGEPWDVIHFNFGLHDMEYPNGCTFPPDDPSLYDPLVPLGENPGEYQYNLRQIIDIMRAHSPDAVLLWATTTVVPPGGNRLPTDPPIYNAAAATVMNEYGIVTDDLYSLSVILRQDPAMYPPGYDVHYTVLGYQNLAENVSDSIREVIPEPATICLLAFGGWSLLFRRKRKFVFVYRSLR
ncbi:MAG: PEP-CTERM sorting domain-containing protein [Phycisphaerae bacterium]|nr:PEP-CTERM sorting domain-containing protein [Phycisphaerae bacterium]